MTMTINLEGHAHILSLVADNTGVHGTSRNNREDLRTTPYLHI